MGAMKKIENMEKNLENLSPDMFTFAEYDANAAERTGYSNYSYWASTWRVFTKNKVAMFFLTLLIALMVFTFIQPYLPGQKNPIEVYLSRRQESRTETSRPVPITGLERTPLARTYGPGSGAVHVPLCSSAWPWASGMPLWVSSSALSGAM